MSNVIKAVFDGSTKSIVTKPQYMWAKGQILLIQGLELPDAFRVNISNTLNGMSKTQIGESNIVSIPNKYFTTGKNIYVWIVVSGEDDVTIKYDIEIPILTAGEPEDYDPTDEQADIITQAISALSTAINALNSATERVDSAVTKMESLVFEINSVGELEYTYEERGE
jgi:hypothetical protein